MPRFHDPSLVLPAQKRLSVVLLAAGLHLVGVSLCLLFVFFVELTEPNISHGDIIGACGLGFVTVIFFLFPGVLLLAAAKGIRCGRDWARQAGRLYIAAFGTISAVVVFCLFNGSDFDRQSLAFFVFPFLLPGVGLAILMLIDFINLAIAERRRKRRNEQQRRPK